MLDGNVLLRQECDEVPEGTLSCPDRNLAVFHHYRLYEGLRLLPSVCEQIIIQQTLFNHFSPIFSLYSICYNRYSVYSTNILLLRVQYLRIVQSY